MCAVGLRSLRTGPPPSGDRLRPKNLRRRCNASLRRPGALAGTVRSPGVAALCLVAFGAAFPADPGLDEAVDVTVEHGAGVADLVLGAQILDHLVRVQYVGAHLVAPARLDVSGHGLLLCLSLIHISEPTRLGMISYAV